MREMSLYLNVPYSEKDEAKALGARWNPEVKKWFVDLPREQYVRFSKWILRDTDDVTIATEYLYLVEGQQDCWRCGQPTRVVGLGIGEHLHLFDGPDGVESEFVEDIFEFGEELHLAWAEESEIPPKLLRYLKERYSVRTGYSKTLERNCFANHCDHCGVLQGNWFLFQEPDSSLSSCVGGEELIKRMNLLKIKLIPIEDDLQLNWNMRFCSNDFAYLKYGEVEKLSLSTDPENECVSYKELYRR